MTRARCQRGWSARCWGRSPSTRPTPRGSPFGRGQSDACPSIRTDATRVRRGTRSRRFRCSRQASARLVECHSHSPLSGRVRPPRRPGVTGAWGCSLARNARSLVCNETTYGALAPTTPSCAWSCRETVSECACTTCGHEVTPTHGSHAICISLVPARNNTQTSDRRGTRFGLSGESECAGHGHTQSDSERRLIDGRRRAPFHRLKGTRHAGPGALCCTNEETIAHIASAHPNVLSWVLLNCVTVQYRLSAHTRREPTAVQRVCK